MNSKLELLITEQVNENTKDIDKCSTIDILKLINAEDRKVPEAVAEQLDNIADAVDAVVRGLKAGGRLFYFGAGTSGRIGVLDASECPPTFGTDPETVQGVIAGEAFKNAAEDAEDSFDLGKNAAADKKIGINDIVIGIAASGRTPFVLGAMEEARLAGAVTVGISNNRDSLLAKEADIAITPVTGPEVIMGSTRMKAGTSQKLILNMISTASMIKLGKVYRNLMVDVRTTNEKLLNRAARIVSLATGADFEKAELYLKEAAFNPKTAIVMLLTGRNRKDAESLLKESDGFISRIEE